VLHCRTKYLSYRFSWRKEKKNDLRTVLSTNCTEPIRIKITDKLQSGFPMPNLEEIHVLVLKIKHADTRNLHTACSCYEFVQRTYNAEK